MTQQERLFGTSGIRGIPGEELTPDFISEISQAIGTFFNEGPILIGHDTRNSSPMISEGVAAGLMSVGIEVGEAGLLPTPALQFSVKNMEYKGGVMITASHNPSKYNGIKVSGPDGIDVNRDEEKEIEDIYFKKKFNLADWKTAGTSFQETKAVRNYIIGIINQVDSEMIKKKNFKIIVDAGNGAQGVAAPYLLEKLNCEPITLNAQADGNFPGRGAEPTPAVLKDLSESVKVFEADLGVAYDGDGDRSLFCDEKGTVHWGDKSAALLVEYILKSKPGATIVTTISASKVIDDLVEKHGGKIVKTRVGSVDVSNTMIDKEALFGLEENGGCFYAPHIPVRDGAMTTALILEALAKDGRRFSEILNELPSYHQRKTKFECDKEKVSEVMDKIRSKASGKIETIDGIKIWEDDNTWILLRPSGTEPVIRVFAESDDSKKLDNIIMEYSRIVKESLKI